VGDLKVPELRFPEFGETWCSMSLHKLLTESKNRNYSNKYSKEDVFSVSGEHGIVNQIELKGRSFAGISVSNYHTVEPDDIVYTKSPLKANPYGIIKHNSGKSGIVSTLYAVYRPTSLTYSKFLDYYFQLNDHTNRYLRPLVHKGAKNDMKINNAHVLDGAIYAPLREEQEKIAAFLTIMDMKMSALKAMLQLLKRYKKGVMHEIFTRQIRFKDENGEDYPAWKVKTLGRVGCPYGGLTGKGGDDFGSGKPFITYVQIFKGSTIQLAETSRVRISQSEKQNQALKGDIFFTISSETPEEVGYSSVLLDDVDELYLNSFCFGYRINDSKELLPEFAQFLFRNSLFRSQVVRLAQGSTRYNLSKNELMKVSIDFPHLDEQRRIASFLTSLDEKIKLEETKLEQARLFKKSLLQKMFV
jgi:type I restriction enzyme S subunit